MLNTIDLPEALALTAGAYVIFILAICLFLKVPVMTTIITRADFLNYFIYRL